MQIRITPHPYDNAEPSLVAGWAEFALDNADGLTVAELQRIATRLNAGEQVKIGGGAEPVFMLEKVVS